MNLHIARTTRHIAAIVAVVGTLFSIGGTLTLAEHYAHNDAVTRTLVQSTNAKAVA